MVADWLRWPEGGESTLALYAFPAARTPVACVPVVWAPVASARMRTSVSRETLVSLIQVQTTDLVMGDGTCGFAGGLTRPAKMLSPVGACRGFVDDSMRLRDELGWGG